MKVHTKLVAGKGQSASQPLMRSQKAHIHQLLRRNGIQSSNISMLTSHIADLVWNVRWTRKYMSPALWSLSSVLVVSDWRPKVSCWYDLGFKRHYAMMVRRQFLVVVHLTFFCANHLSVNIACIVRKYIFCRYQKKNMLSWQKTTSANLGIAWFSFWRCWLSHVCHAQWSNYRYWWGFLTDVGPCLPQFWIKNTTLIHILFIRSKALYGCYQLQSNFCIKVIH